MTYQRTKLTVKDYMATPEDMRCQLIDGELILAPSPTVRHQRIVLNLAAALQGLVRQHGIGFVWIAPLDVVLADNEVFQPDILLVSKERQGIRTEANIQGAPDLVVEVLSPSTEGHDRGHKQQVYGRSGVREYWIVDPGAETVEVLSDPHPNPPPGREREQGRGLTLTATYGSDDALISPLLPGLSIGLGEVFAED